jgi:hypothetical protein
MLPFAGVIFFRLLIFSARNGHLEELVPFLRAKQGYTARRKENSKRISYMLIRADMKFRNEKKFQYGIPAYTGPFRALLILHFVLLACV